MSTTTLSSVLLVVLSTGTAVAAPSSPSSTAGPVKVRFKTAERYETKNEWGTSYRAGLQVGSLGRKPVILTRTYKVARAKPETVMGVIGWLWGATTSPAQYKIEIGRIALPTFGLGARWANRLTDFPTTATFENYDNQNH